VAAPCFGFVEFVFLGAGFGAGVAEGGAQVAVGGLVAGEEEFGGGEEVVEGGGGEGVDGAVWE